MGKRIILALLLVCQTVVFAQQSIKISGKVFQKDTNTALEFANVSIISTSNQPAASAVTNHQGEFTLSVLPGTYTLKVAFIGFKEATMEHLALENDQVLAAIYLENDATLLQTVEINSGKSTIEHQLDKKVFNVGNELVSKGGSANDILNNVPSVSVNASGVVSLRGNPGVRILINGKPSVLTSNNGLEQIPSENIEKVEVITNPSSKYDSEGTAGIINIVLKKNKNSGFGSSVQVTTGIPDNHALGYNVSYKTSKINLFSDLRYRYVTYFGNESSFRSNFGSNGVSFLDGTVNRESSNRIFNIYIGGDYYINDKNTLTLSYYHRNNTSKNKVDYRYDYLDANKLPAQIVNASESYREPQKANQVELNYVKNFETANKKLTFNLQYDFWNDDENELITEQQLFPALPEKTIKSHDIESSKDFLFQTDYTHPIGEKSKIEFGAKGEFRKINSDYEVFDNAVLVDSLDNVLHYREQIFGAYFQYGSAYKKLQYLLGLRLENADTGSDDALNQFNIDKKYTDLFPTAHLTYSFTEAINLQLSYSRRIQRPRFWQLNPFGGIADRSNIFIGNPDLDPMYTNSYELSTLIKWHALTINPSVYHQFTTNLFEDSFFTNANGVLIEQSINSGKESRLGFELGLTYAPLKWLNFSGEMNYFTFKQRGIYNISDQAFTSRLNSKIKQSSWNAQANFNYLGQRKSGQTFSEDQYWVDLAVGKDIWKEKATITLRADNILDSRISKGFFSGEDYTSSYSRRQSGTRVSATFTYRFNRKKNEKERLPD